MFKNKILNNQPLKYFIYFLIVLIFEVFVGSCIVFNFFGNPFLPIPECAGMFLLSNYCILSNYPVSITYLIIVLLHTIIQFNLYKIKCRNIKLSILNIFNILIDLLNMIIFIYLLFFAISSFFLIPLLLIYFYIQIKINKIAIKNK